MTIFTQGNDIKMTVMKALKRLFMEWASDIFIKFIERETICSSQSIELMQGIRYGQLNLILQNLYIE